MNQPPLDCAFRLTRARVKAKNMKQPFRDRRNDIPDKEVSKPIRKQKHTSGDAKAEKDKHLATKVKENILYEVKKVSPSGLKLRFHRVITEKPSMMSEPISKTVNPEPKPALSIREYAKQIQPKVCPMIYPTSNKEVNELILQVSEPETNWANSNQTENRFSLKSNHVINKSDEQIKMEETLARLKDEKEAKLMEKVKIYRARLQVVARNAVLVEEITCRDYKI